MLKATDGVPFSVVFFNGDTTVNVGHLTVDSSMSFKNFQSDVAHRIGLSPHQLSIYLGSSESSRKIPITRKVNFAAIARQNNDGAFFFVKRRARRHKTNRESRRTQNPNPKPNPSKNKNFNFPPHYPDQNVKLLKRNSGFDFDLFEFQSSLVDRVRNLQIEKERFLMNMGIGIGIGIPVGNRNDDDHDDDNGNLNCGLVCEVCSSSVGNVSDCDLGFHWCVLDAVTQGFRSPAGPIARPIKNFC